MTSDSNSYAYYSFPRTPPSLTPTTSRSSSKTDTFHTPHSTPTRASFNRGEMSTASASAKNQGGPPKTPTKLSRKPAPLSSAKLDSKDQGTKSSTPSGKSAAGDAKQSLDDKKSAAKGLSGKADKATSDTKDQAKGAADSAKGAASNVQDKAKEGAQGASSEGQDDDEPLSKVSQAAEESSGDLKDAAPVPIPDDEDEADDATAGADASGKDDITETAGDAADQTKDQASKAADQATGATEDTTDKAQDAAKQTTDKAKDTAGDSSDKAQGATKQASDKAQDTTKKSTDQTKGTIDQAKDSVSGATDKAQDTSQEDADDADDIPDDTTEKAGALGETSADDTADAQSQAGDGGLLKGAKGLAGRASAVAGRNAKKPAQQATDTADEAVSGAQETGEKAKSGAEDAAGNAQEGLEDATEDAEQTAQDAKQTADDTADEAQESAKDTSKEAEGAVKDGDKTTDGAADIEEHTANAGEAVEEGDKAAQDLDVSVPDNLPLDMSVLNGLEVQSDGRILNSDGEQIGRLVEGDAEDLEGYPIHEGEILDEDGDLVGRVELLPEEIKRQLQQAKDDGVELPDGADEYLDHLDDENEEDEGLALPGLDILEGLTCGIDGLVYDDEGNTVGKVVEGDPEELQHAKLNSQGEFVDDDGNVVGRAEIHEEAAELVEQGVYDAAEPEEAQEGAEDVQEITEETQEDTTKAAEGIEDELPGIEALQGRELNEAGEIVDESGDVLGQIHDEELKEKIESGEIDPNTLSINEKGEVVDEDNNVLGSTELAEGAAEKLANVAPTYDVRILDGRKVNKKSKILDDDGEEIGQLVEGDAAKCAGQKVNEKGEVVDKQGKVIGKVKVSEGEAAQEATRQLLEELGEQGQDADLPGLESLDGLKVNKKGQILNEDGEPIGELVEGELSECASKKCNDKGEVLDQDGNVIGRVKTLAAQTEEAEPEEEQEQEQGDEQDEETQDKEEEQVEDDGLPPLSILEGLKVNKSGRILDDKGNIVGELVEGDAKKLSKSGLTCDAEGQFWDNKGHVIGKAKTIAQEEADEESPFAGLDGLKVVEGGWVHDSEGNKVGRVTEGDAKKLVGRSVDEDGDILNNKGSVVGHAERYEEEEEEEVQEEAPADLSFLQGKTVNKAGLVMSDGIPVARVVEGNPKEMANRKLDDQGQIWNDSGKVIGKVELIPEGERESKPEGPFAGLEGLRVIKDGKVADKEENIVGIIVEGDAKRLVGLAVDEDGDIADKYGNVKGHAEPYEEPEEEEPEAEDLSALANTTINKAGHAVDGNGSIIGHIVEGDAKKLVGKKVDGQGQIWDDAGNVVGRCELSKGEDNAEDGPFAGFEGLKVQKDGTVTTAAGDIVGRVVEGDIKKLVSHSVDDDGDILNKNGNKLGKAERWEPEEKERRKNPMSGLRINKEGEVRNQDGDLVGRLTDGALGHCVGQEIDDNGNVVDQDGNKIGEATLLENIVEEEYEGPSEEELEEARKRDEEREIANKMANICQQTLERMQPICKQISEHMEAADRTPKDELDEEELVNKVKPLIEEGGRYLQECNGSLRGLDPDGHIAAQAKGRSGSNEATPEEHRLAETLKELTTTVVTTIDNAKKKLNDMPHAKKKLNPLWSLLTQPLFQILAAVGLLLAGVLGLVGQLLNGLGLGGLVNGLLGGLGIDKLLASFGLGGGDKKKKGNPIGSLPVIGGLLGGK